MSKIELQLKARSQDQCELCKAENDLQVYSLKPDLADQEAHCAYICSTCVAQIDGQSSMLAEHWKVLSDTMWTEHAPVQVLAWRMLNRLKNEAWAQDNLDILYLDDAVLEWAKEAGEEDPQTQLMHIDSHGNQLFNGDSVVLIKSLDVKGSSLTAKLGTVVKNIRLDANNAEYIEGRVDGQLIVILTKYTRRQS